VPGDILGHALAWRVGQVVPERDPNTVTGRGEPDHDQAVLGHEPEQLRDDGQQGRRRTDPHDGGGGGHDWPSRLAASATATG
jgi:hypothetical protein